MFLLLPCLQDLDVNVDVHEDEESHGEDAGGDEHEPVEVVDDVVRVLPQLRDLDLGRGQPREQAPIIVCCGFGGNVAHASCLLQSLQLNNKLIISPHLYSYIVLTFFNT